MLKIYRVLKKFDSSKDYGFDIRPQFAKCLETMKKNDKINSKEFATTHRGEFVSRRNTMDANLAVIHKAITIGKRLGVLEEIPHDSVPILYKDFLKLESIRKFRNRVSGSNKINTKITSDGSKDTYTRHLHYFNNWIFGKKFLHTSLVQTGENNFERKQKPVKLESVEHFLNLYSQYYSEKQPFIELITDYFFESKVKSEDPSTKKIKFFAIKNYFKKNNHSITLDFDPNEGTRPIKDDSEPIMHLGELLQLLTSGNPTIMEKAVFLCKFQRGLDSSTLVDRFNKEAWSQIVEAFETADYTQWDLKKCPILIKLTRVKTDVSHVGFLDHDAIVAVIDYLKHRENLTGKKMNRNDFLFLNGHQNEITESWISQSFSKLRTNAGLDDIVNSTKLTKQGGKKKYRISTHETRDLLKSVLIESNVRLDLVEEFIGHKPHDSYEKQVRVFDDRPRTEYIKASSRVNIFSKAQRIFKGEFDSSDNMKNEIDKLKLGMQKMDKRISRTDKLKRKK